MSKDDVLVRYTVSCFDDGRGRRFRDMLQNDDKYIAFKHVAHQARRASHQSRARP